MRKNYQQFASFLIVLTFLFLSSGYGFAHFEIDIYQKDQKISYFVKKYDPSIENDKGTLFDRGSGHFTKNDTMNLKNSLGSLEITNGKLKVEASGLIVNFCTGSISIAKLIAAKVLNKDESTLTVDLLGKDTIFENHGIANFRNTSSNKMKLGDIQNEEGFVGFEGPFSIGSIKSRVSAVTNVAPDSELVCLLANLKGKLGAAGSHLTIEQEQENAGNQFNAIECDRLTGKFGPKVNVQKLLPGTIKTNQLALKQKGITKVQEANLALYSKVHEFSALQVNNLKFSRAEVEGLPKAISDTVQAVKNKALFGGVKIVEFYQKSLPGFLHQKTDAILEDRVKVDVVSKGTTLSLVDYLNSAHGQVAQRDGGSDTLKAKMFGKSAIPPNEFFPKFLNLPRFQMGAHDYSVVHFLNCMHDSVKMDGSLNRTMMNFYDGMVDVKDGVGSYGKPNIIGHIDMVRIVHILNGFIRECILNNLGASEVKDVFKAGKINLSEAQWKKVKNNLILKFATFNSKQEAEQKATFIQQSLGMLDDGLVKAQEILVKDILALVWPVSDIVKKDGKIEPGLVQEIFKDVDDTAKLKGLKSALSFYLEISHLDLN